VGREFDFTKHPKFLKHFQSILQAVASGTRVEVAKLQAFHRQWLGGDNDAPYKESD